MTSFTTNASAVIAGLFCMAQLSAAADTELCSELTRHFPNGNAVNLATAERKATRAEEQAIKNSKTELLQTNDYSIGYSIVDADNDGKDDLLAWSVQGTGRFVFAELFDIPAAKRSSSDKLVPKAAVLLGLLRDPSFFKFKGTNYIASTGTGDETGTTISRLVKLANGRYEQHVHCRAEILLKTETSCRHPACRKLKETIDNDTASNVFRDIEWPHKYVQAAGLSVYFSEDWSRGDFDNTKSPTTIWRAGRANYDFDHIYWSLLGQGNEMPTIDATLRPPSGGLTRQGILPGPQHDRLRRTLAEQSEVLSRELNRPIALPTVGEFFLFSAHEGRTYWAWDFGRPAYGEQIHITYTNANKSDYIVAPAKARQPA